MTFEKRKGPLAATPPKSDRLAGAIEIDNTALRAASQCRLARRLAALAGLSLAVAVVLVVLALRDGGQA